MGKKGGRRHLKRKPAPAFWPIHRKEAVWAAKPDAGPHAAAQSLPLVFVLRDTLGVAKTRREVKTMLSQEKVLVDGIIQKDEHFPTGLMDVISIRDAEKWYRVLPSEKGLMLHPISKDEAGVKLCRVEDKTILKGGNVQLNLHDGRNLLIPVKDPNRHEEDIFKTLDTVEIAIPSQEIKGHLKMTEGVPAIIVGGKNVGKHGKVVAIEHREGQKRKNSLVTTEDSRGNRFQTTVEYVFVIGDKQTHISLPEVA